MLALDCGNTALKCRYDGVFNSFLIHDLSFNKDFSSYLLSIPKSEQVVLSCVSSIEIEKLLLKILKDYFEQPVEIAQTEKRFKTLKNGYQNYSELGVDRWLAMIACQSEQHATVVIDAGSWIKMDAILKNGQHLGGVIISKTEKDERTLLERFHVSLDVFDNEWFGKNTQSCISIASENYGRKAVLYVLQHWIKSIGEPCLIIVGGGDGTQLKRALQTDLKQSNQLIDIQLKENLVLSGLLTQYQNQSN